MKKKNQEKIKSEDNETFLTSGYRKILAQEDISKSWNLYVLLKKFQYLMTSELFENYKKEFLNIILISEKKVKKLNSLYNENEFSLDKLIKGFGDRNPFFP